MPRKIDHGTDWMTRPKAAPEPHGHWTTVILECGHTVPFAFGPPKRKEEIWCKRCAKMRIVRDLYRGSGGYHVKCTNCKYGKSYGESKLTAERAMARHRLKEPTHTMVLYDGDGREVDRWVSALENREDLFGEGDPDKPPF